MNPTLTKKETPEIIDPVTERIICIESNQQSGETVRHLSNNSAGHQTEVRNSQHLKIDNANISTLINDSSRNIDVNLSFDKSIHIPVSVPWSSGGPPSASKMAEVCNKTFVNKPKYMEECKLLRSGIERESAKLKMGKAKMIDNV